MGLKYISHYDARHGQWAEAMKEFRGREQAMKDSGKFAYVYPNGYVIPKGAHITGGILNNDAARWHGDYSDEYIGAEGA